MFKNYSPLEKGEGGIEEQFMILERIILIDN